MDNSSKITNSRNNVYVGTLTNGKPIVYIGGHVEESDCQWAMEMLDDLLNQGKQEIVVDYDSVRNMTHAWFASQIRIRKRRFKELVKISARDSCQQFASSTAGPTQCSVGYVQKTNPDLFRLLSRVFSFREPHGLE